MKDCTFCIDSVPPPVVNVQTSVHGRKNAGRLVRARFLLQPPFDLSSRIFPDQNANPNSWAVGRPNQRSWVIRFHNLVRGNYRVELRFDDGTTEEYEFYATGQVLQSVQGVRIAYPVSRAVNGATITAYGDSETNINTALDPNGDRITYISVDGVKHTGQQTLLIDSAPPDEFWMLEFLDVAPGNATLHVENVNNDSAESNFTVT